MKIAGVIIAGGRSTRMGEEKAFLTLGGRSILARVIERLVPQVTSITINANGPAERFSSLGLMVIPDLRSDVGTPLAGLHAGLKWGREHDFDAILTVPSDCPFLPHDLARRLAAHHPRPAIAASGGQSHFLTGLWPQHLLETLERAITVERMDRVKDWARLVDAVPVDWPITPHDPFLNINTPDDLAAAQRVAE